MWDILLISDGFDIALQLYNSGYQSVCMNEEREWILYDVQSLSVFVDLLSVMMAVFHFIT